MAELAQVAPAFVDMAHRIVWATVATVDPQGRAFRNAEGSRQRTAHLARSKCTVMTRWPAPRLCKRPFCLAAQEDRRRTVN
jgi:hypothetical protein